MAKAYITKRFKVIQPVYDYICGLAKGLSPELHTLFCHILACTLAKIRVESKDLYSAVPRDVRRKRIGRKTDKWRLLYERSLIEFKGYCKAKGQARKYKAADWVVDEICAITDSLSYYEYHLKPKVNLMVGKPYLDSQISTSPLTYHRESNRNSLPKLYCSHIKILKRNKRRFYWPACEEVLNWRKAKMEYLAAELDRVGIDFGLYSVEYKQAEKDYKKAKKQWQHDHLCFLSVLDRKPQRLSGEPFGYWEYEACYNYSDFGRCYEERGGFQNASKELKDASIKDLKNVYREQVYNNDLRACHLNALRMLCKRAGLDKTWLDVNLTNESFREEMALRVGLPTKTIKKILNSLINGAVFPDTVKVPRLQPDSKQKWRRESSINHILREAVGNNKARLQAALDALRVEVQGLLDILDEFHKWVETVFIPEKKHRAKKSKRWFIRNDYDFPYYLDELDAITDKWERRAQLAAFFFQGIEAHFIATLTVLGDKYGYMTIANEHDGILTVGKIPHEAIDEAIRETGFEYAELTEEEGFTKKTALA